MANPGWSQQPPSNHIGRGHSTPFETASKANERLTDVAMFVFGLGDIFLAGYRTTPGVEYRSGHRLGYLNGAGYEDIRDHVAELRRTRHLQPTKAAGPQVTLKCAIPGCPG